MNSRLLGALVLACVLLAAFAGTASGHAELLESDPADGETIETPYQLTARFSEPLAREGSRVVVRNEAGDEIAVGGPRPDDPELIVVELPELPPGEYAARWTALTTDDMGVTRGTIEFTVVAHVSAAPPAATADQATRPPSPASSPGSSPSPAPGDGEQAAGITDVLLALVLAGAVIGGLSLYLLRRR